MSSTPKRKVLHERARSQNNELPAAPTLRLVPSQDDNSDVDNYSDEGHDIYSTTPYPTKESHVLLPTHGSHSQAGHSPVSTVSDFSQSLNPEFYSASGSTTQNDLPGRHSGTASELSSFVQPENACSSIWDAGPSSSKSSVPCFETPHVSDEDEEESSEHSSITALPRPHMTIKTVPQDQEPSSTPPPMPESRPRLYTTGSDESSNSNAEASSPNVVQITSSSPNVVPIGTSPNFVRAAVSDSSLYSANSFGTARRYIGRNPNNYSDYTSDAYSFRTQSIPSSPPTRVLRSFNSGSSFAPPVSESHSGRPRTASTRSTPSSLGIQASINSAVAVQYSTLHSPFAPSSSDNASVVLDQERPRSMHDRPVTRWGRHSSSVRSEWSSSSPDGDHVAANDRSLATDDSLQLSRKVTKVSEHSEWEELSDSVTNLRTPKPTLQKKTSGNMSRGSSISRLECVRTLSRPGSSTSAMLYRVPSWAQIYYCSGSHGLFLPTLSRPSTPFDVRPTTRAANQPVAPAPALKEISLPRTRPRQNTLPSQPEQKTIESSRDPGDPRTHWSGIEQTEEIVPEPLPEEPLSLMPSPHLHPNTRRNTARTSTWEAPQPNESSENFWSTRNIQIYSFCLGFICPLVWFIASFLSLPAMPTTFDTSEEDLEKAVPQIDCEQQIRYESARWWRTVNRFMGLVGMVIILLVIILSVCGTKGII